MESMIGLNSLHLIGRICKCWRVWKHWIYCLNRRNWHKAYHIVELKVSLSLGSVFFFFCIWIHPYQRVIY
jgi:hypothetical protein